MFKFILYCKPPHESRTCKRENKSLLLTDKKREKFNFSSCLEDVIVDKYALF